MIVDAAYIAYARRLEREALERWLEVELDASVPECCRSLQTALRANHVAVKPAPSRTLAELEREVFDGIAREEFPELPRLEWSRLLGWYDPARLAPEIREPLR
jgi:hypothetical protein